MGKKKQKSNQPFVSICTPTFNRRPFIPYMIKCFEHQTYPKDKIEWIIIDDGTDKIEDLVTHIPQVKYFKYAEKLTLGKKRNIMHSKTKGEIILYMDDDDYYPPERISHAVEMLLKNPNALCAGSSIMHIYFKHINKMYKFGPYGDKHATAATFAFRRKLLECTSYDENACLAEEKHFLKDYTIPFVQLDTMKTILVFSHNHNSFDKKELLNQGSNPYINESTLTPSDFIPNADILHFFLNDIDQQLQEYSQGNPENKPDVIAELNVMKQKRNDMMKQRQLQQMQQPPNIFTKINTTQDKITNPQIQQMNNLSIMVQELSLENKFLKEKITYLETKISELIQDKINTIQQNKKKD
jgi:glycosyltransferase involved in cell wall biosynthesis